MKALAFLAVTLFGANSALAQAPSRSWTALLATEGDRVDIDRSSIETAGSHRRAWLRWQYPQAGEPTQVRIEHHEVDCTQRRVRIVAAQRAERDRNGEARLMDSLPTTTETEWQRPGPGSLAGQVVTAVCSVDRARA